MATVADPIDAPTEASFDGSVENSLGDPAEALADNPLHVGINVPYPLAGGLVDTDLRLSRDYAEDLAHNPQSREAAYYGSWDLWLQFVRTSANEKFRDIHSSWRFLSAPQHAHTVFRVSQATPVTSPPPSPPPGFPSPRQPHALLSSVQAVASYDPDGSDNASISEYGTNSEGGSSAGGPLSENGDGNDEGGDDDGDGNSDGGGKDAGDGHSSDSDYVDSESGDDEDYKGKTVSLRRSARRQIETTAIPDGHLYLAR